MKFRKKPVVIEAIQYIGDNKKEILDFCNKEKTIAFTNTCYDHLTIRTLEGAHRADVGDWIIKGVAGEFYPCKSDIFNLTYEHAKNDNEIDMYLITLGTSKTPTELLFWRKEKAEEKKKELEQNYPDILFEVTEVEIIAKGR